MRINCKIKNNLAFTLAEVLIVVGIIGVVASIVIPTLMAKQEQAANITAWKKLYSVINSAQMTIANDNGGDLTLGFPGVSGSSTTSFNNFASGWVPYLKVIKQCAANKSISDGCYSGTMRALSDTSTVTNYSTFTPSIVLNDGTVLFFYPGSSAICGTATFCYDTHIYIDVNGSKLPNRFGKDIFDVQYKENKRLFAPPHYTNSACSYEGINCSEYYLLR